MGSNTQTVVIVLIADAAELHLDSRRVQVSAAAAAAAAPPPNLSAWKLCSVKCVNFYSKKIIFFPLNICCADECVSVILSSATSSLTTFLQEIFTEEN